MYSLNKLVGTFLNPTSIALMLAVVGLLVAARWKSKLGRRMIVIAFVWLYIWSTPIVYRWVGGSLENEWPVVLAKDAPNADAIVVLGGGMGANTNNYVYAEMWGGADRVWHAARLYKAGKAPVVIPTGSLEEYATVPLLVDLGVPPGAIVAEGEARNTEENAKFVRDLVLASKNTTEVEGRVGRVLLVTSAWHMRRSLLMFNRYAPELEVIPAPTDYEATVRLGKGLSLYDLIPSADTLAANSYCFKEHLGYWGYRLFRK